MHRVRISLSPIVVGLMAALALSGCNNCEKMVEKLCTDLGPDDCGIWKKNGLDQSMIPGGRKVNSACGTMMSDAAYPGVLKGARQQVAAMRKIEQAKAKIKNQ